MEVLDKLESVPINAQSDKPLKDIVIEDTLVLENPFRDAIAEILMKEWKSKSQKAKEERSKEDKWTSLSGLRPENKAKKQENAGIESIGKYVGNNFGSKKPT